MILVPSIEDIDINSYLSAMKDEDITNAFEDVIYSNCKIYVFL